MAVSLGNHVLVFSLKQYDFLARFGASEVYPWQLLTYVDIVGRILLYMLYIYIYLYKYLGSRSLIPPGLSEQTPGRDECRHGLCVLLLGDLGSGRS